MSDLKRVSPKELGMDCDALCAYLDRLGRSGCHSVMVLHRGAVALEGWWSPYKKEYNHTAYSLSKSFVSAAVGFACQEGILSLDDEVMGFFPERFSCAPCENMRKLTIRHLLTMNMGHRGITDHDFYRAQIWLDEVMHLYLENEPGSDFFYDNRCTFICSIILQRKTGQTVFDYLKPRLLEPLGIKGAWWETRDGFNQGGWGLNLCTEDIARFGQFLLNRGKWDGRQLLMPEYIDAAGSKQTETAGVSVYEWADWQQGYGYFFWQCVPDEVYRGDGAFGQFVIVAPKQDAVIAMTAGTGRACELLEATWEMLERAFKGPAGNAEALRVKAAALCIDPPTGTKCPPELAKYSGVTYKFPKNSSGIEKLTVVFGLTDKVSFVINGEEFTAFAGHGRWVETATGYQSGRFNAMTSFFYSDAACAGAWSDGEYVLKTAFTRTPFVDTLRLKFDGALLRLTYACDPVLPLRNSTFELLGGVEEGTNI